MYPTQEEALRVLNQGPLYVISPKINSSIKGLSKKKRQLFLKMAVDFNLGYHLGFARRKGNWMQLIGYGIDASRKDGQEILFRQLTWLKSINLLMDELIKPLIPRIYKHMIKLPTYNTDIFRFLDGSESDFAYVQLSQLMEQIYQLTDRELNVCI